MSVLCLDLSMSYLVEKDQIEIYTRGQWALCALRSPHATVCHLYLGQTSISYFRLLSYHERTQHIYYIIQCGAHCRQLWAVTGAEARWRNRCVVANRRRLPHWTAVFPCILFVSFMCVLVVYIYSNSLIYVTKHIWDMPRWRITFTVKGNMPPYFHICVLLLQCLGSFI